MNPGINIIHLREILIRPVLKEYSYWSESAENLLVGTCIQESLAGYFWKQNLQGVDGRGIAVGIFQMEPKTYYDIYKNYLRYPKNVDKLMNIIDHFKLDIFTEAPLDDIEFIEFKFKEKIYYTTIPEPRHLIFNLEYAILMARFQYMRHAEPLPPAENIKELAFYYKKYYNSNNGKAKISEFIQNYNRFAS